MQSRFSIRSLILLFPFIATSAQGGALRDQDYFGRVTQVTAGDRLQVHNGQRKDNLRVYGVECVPAWSLEAKHFTRDLAASRGVHVCIVGKTKRGGRVAKVNFIGGRSLSEELVSNGMARWDRTQAPHDKKLAALEAEARSARRGIWKKGD